MSLSRFVGRLESFAKLDARTLLSGVDQGLELGMGFRDVGRDGADDVDFEVVVFGVLEGGGDEFLGDTAAAKGFGDFGVDEGEPALAVGFEFEIAGLAVLLDLETAAGYLGWVVHGCTFVIDDGSGVVEWRKVFQSAFSRAALASFRSILALCPCVSKSDNNSPPLRRVSGFPLAKSYASGPYVEVVTKIPLVAPSL